MAMLDTVNKQYKVPKHTRHLPWIHSNVAHHPFTNCIVYTGDLVHWVTPCRLASAPTVGYYTSLWKKVRE